MKSGLLFTLFNIAKHPTVQQTIINEIHTIFGTTVGQKEITLHRLNDMHYLEMTIRESLRLYPSIPVIGRKVLEETNISKLYMRIRAVIYHFNIFACAQMDELYRPIRI